jgi:serine protease AprX
MLPGGLTVLAPGAHEETLVRLGVPPGTAIERHGAYLCAAAGADAAQALRASGLLVNEQAALPTPPLSVVPQAGEVAKLQVAQPLSEAKQEWLRNNGVRLLRKVDNTSYLAHIDTPRGGGDPDWMQWARYGPDDRMPEALARHSAPRASLLDTFKSFIGMETASAASAQLAFDVDCHDRGNLQALHDKLKTDGRIAAVTLGETRLRFVAKRVNDAHEIVNEMRDKAIVSHVEPYIPPQPLVSYAVGAMLGNLKPPNLQWRGKGQILGVADTGIDVDHPDLRGRVEVVFHATPLSPRDPWGHGTHVTSIAAGDGTASGGQLAGIAPEARVFFQSLAADGPQLQIGIGPRALLKESYERGVRVQNYSWGSSVGSRFTLDALDLDQFMYDHPDMLVVVACGNSGAQPPEGGANSRIDLHSLNSPGTAKNALAVGATCSPRPDGPFADRRWKDFGTNPPSRPPMSDLPVTGDGSVVAPLSSRGPSHDGRVKPDLLAPGIGIASACSADHQPQDPFPQFDGRYRYASGTSMAAPMVAGAAIVLRQYFIEQRGHQPTAALLKACLINAAQWMENVLWEDKGIGKPNFHQGHGSLRLDRALPDAASGYALLYEDIGNGSPRALKAGTNQADDMPWKRRIDVGTGHPFSITMAWTDPPGKFIQHQLDLVVTDPSGAQRVGNPDLQRLSFESFDNRNNVEKIVFDDPQPGSWLVQVFPRDTIKGPQGFALAVTGQVAWQA